MKVLFKKGDPQLPQNYQPISIIPVMAKLFSTVLYARIVDRIEDRLSEEQFGFRLGRGCSDAVHVMRMIVEKSAEWGEELWVAALDVEKAFDKVHHGALFEALLTTGIDAHVGAALRRLYWEMSGYVALWPGAESRTFEVQRGVRQGNPLSPLLFNLVLDGALQEVSVIWQRRGYGTNVGLDARGQRLTHVAFADDQTLLARIWLSMQRMLSTLKVALSKRGLALHPAKCKVQTNKGDWATRGEVTIEPGFTVQVLPADEPLRLLGTDLSLLDATGCEIQNRISAGWRMFWSMQRLPFEHEYLNKKEAEAIRQHGVELRPMVRGVVDATG